MWSLETPLLVFSRDEWRFREADCGRKVCGSARITNDLAGSSLNSAIVNAPLCVSPRGPRWLGGGMGLLEMRGFLSLSVTWPYLCTFS